MTRNIASSLSLQRAQIGDQVIEICFAQQVSVGGHQRFLRQIERLELRFAEGPNILGTIHDEDVVAVLVHHDSLDAFAFRCDKSHSLVTAGHFARGLQQRFAQLLVCVLHARKRHVRAKPAAATSDGVAG